MTIQRAVSVIAEEERTMNKRWMAVVMGALLVGALIGVVWVRPGQSAQAAGGTRKVNIPAALFQPIREGRDWWWRSDHLEMNTGLGEFVAPVMFPCLSSVTVERIILYAYDDSGVGAPVRTSSGPSRTVAPSSV
jgi:hypothetical protein